MHTTNRTMFIIICFAFSHGSPTLLPFLRFTLLLYVYSSWERLTLMLFNDFAAHDVLTSLIRMMWINGVETKIIIMVVYRHFFWKDITQYPYLLRVRWDEQLERFSTKPYQSDWNPVNSLFTCRAVINTLICC